MIIEKEQLIIIEKEQLEDWCTYLKFKSTYKGKELSFSSAFSYTPGKSLGRFEDIVILYAKSGQKDYSLYVMDGDSLRVILNARATYRRILHDLEMKVPGLVKFLYNVKIGEDTIPKHWWWPR